MVGLVGAVVGGGVGGGVGGRVGGGVGQALQPLRQLEQHWLQQPPPQHKKHSLRRVRLKLSAMAEPWSAGR